MARFITQKSLFLIPFLIMAPTPTQAGISISIGAHWGTKHPVVVRPVRPSRVPACRRAIPHRYHHRLYNQHRHPHWRQCWPTPVIPPRCPAPVVVHPQPRSITVWITNSNGSKIAVKLTRRGCGYIGPRGEYYAHRPSNEQLRILYGF